MITVDNHVVQDTPEQHPTTQPRFRAFIPTIALLLLTALVFGRIVTHDFISLDDPTLIYRNAAFNPPNLAGVMRNWWQPQMYLYMPLTYMVWGAVAAMAHRAPDVHGIALNPAYFHAANLLIHLASASAVLVLLRRTVAGGAAAVIGAAVFALHPLQVEPVAWAGDGLYAVLSGALSLWALCHYVKFAQASGSKKVHATLASVLFVAALLSKPSAINVPLIAMVIDVMLLRRPLRKVWPLPAAWAAAGGIFVLAISRFHPTGYIDSPLKWRPIVALDAIGFYLGKLLVPLWLMPDYGRRPQWVMEHVAQAAVTCAGAAAIIVSAIALRRRAPRLAAGLAIFVVALLPFLGLMKFLFQWYSTVADRYTYVPLFGAAIIVAAIVDARRRLVWPASAVVALLAVASIVQAGRWRDSNTLFNYAASVRPTSLIANTVLADDAVARGDDASAVAHYKRAMNERPDDPTAGFNYGNFLLARRQYEAAAQCLARVVFRAPDNANAHTNLGVALANLNQIAGAEFQFRAAIAAAERNGRPDADPWQNLGLVYVGTGREAAAGRAFERALSIDPTLSVARARLDALRGASAGAAGKEDDANAR